MARLYARSRKGERAYAYQPYQRGKNTTIVGAMSLNGLIASMTLDGALDGDAFVAYTEQILVPQLSPGNVVIMDNLSYHKVQGITNAIEAVGAFVLYLPPYSPELSPIENCWSKVKSILRKIAARDDDSLQQAITDAINAVTYEDALG